MSENYIMAQNSKGLNSTKRSQGPVDWTKSLIVNLDHYCVGMESAPGMF